MSFVVEESAWRDPLVVEGFTGIGESLIEGGFPTPLTVHLCDDYMTIMQSMSIDTVDEKQDAVL